MTTERDVLDALYRRYTRMAAGDPPRHVFAEHVRDRPSGAYTTIDGLAMDTWASGRFDVTAFEVKVSRSDYLRELRDPGKSDFWRRHAHRFVIVAPLGVVRGDLPPGWGLLSLCGDGQLRTTQRPARNRHAEPLPAHTVAAFLRAVQQTARYHTRHDTT